MQNPTIVLITDYGTGDPAFTEVMLQLRRFIPDALIIPQSTPPFSTLNTGFWVYQIAFTETLHNTFIYSNTAPRTEDHTAQENNRGEKLMYAKLTDGFEIMAVNAGYVFSFVKPHIAAFHFVNVENEGSQFRSRDKFPRVVAQMVEGDPSFLGQRCETSIIPDYPRNRIASIDGYGNMKTTTRLSECSFTPGQKLNIQIGDVTHEAIFADRTFNVHMGELAFAPGSSGHEDRFMELFYRGKSAYELFKKPLVEEKITILT